VIPGAPQSTEAARRRHRQRQTAGQLAAAGALAGSAWLAKRRGLNPLIGPAVLLGGVYLFAWQAWGR